MVTPTPATWTVRGATFAVWLLAAGSVAYWGLRLGSPAASVDPPAPAPRPLAAVDPGTLTRLLGGTPPAPGEPGEPALAAAPVANLASRLQLVGVVAAAFSGGGAAVIAVDGKPARPYRVGTRVDEGLVLQSVQGRRAVLGAQARGPALVTLELPVVAMAQSAPVSGPAGPVQRPMPNPAPR